MSIRLRLIALALLASTPLGAAHADAADRGAPTREIRLSKDAVLAVSGYDVVSYFSGQPLKGDRAFESTHHGIKFRFANAENQAKFDADPGRYSPMNGGFCVVAAASGKTVKADPHVYTIIDDQLVFANNKANLEKLKADPAKYGVVPRVKPAGQD